jgi:hypothetical protein
MRMTRAVAPHMRQAKQGTIVQISSALARFVDPNMSGYAATEKLEIIRLVEQSRLSARQTLDRLGIPRPAFYRWYDRVLTHGVEGLEDRTSAPSRVWNRIADDIRDRIIAMALDHADLSPRALAVKFTVTESYFVSETSVCRLLKAHDLITSPAISSSRPMTSSRTRPRGGTRCGRPTSPT